MDTKILKQFILDHAHVEQTQEVEVVKELMVDELTGEEFIIEREIVVEGPMTIKELKPHLSACDWCEKTVTDFKATHRLGGTKMNPYWKSRCVTCKKYIHPEDNKPMQSGGISQQLSSIDAYYKKRYK